MPRRACLACSCSSASLWQGLLRQLSMACMQEHAACPAPAAQQSAHAVTWKMPSSGSSARRTCSGMQPVSLMTPQPNRASIPTEGAWALPLHAEAAGPSAGHRPAPLGPVLRPCAACARCRCVRHRRGMSGRRSRGMRPSTRCAPCRFAMLQAWSCIPVCLVA